MYDFGSREWFSNKVNKLNKSFQKELQAMNQFLQGDMKEMTSGVDERTREINLIKDMISKMPKLMKANQQVRMIQTTYNGYKLIHKIHCYKYRHVWTRLFSHDWNNVVTVLFNHQYCHFGGRKQVLTCIFCEQDPDSQDSPFSSVCQAYILGDIGRPIDSVLWFRIVTKSIGIQF